MTEPAEVTEPAEPTGTPGADSRAGELKATVPSPRPRQQGAAPADTPTDPPQAVSAQSDPSLPAPERRGKLTVDQSVVRKVAEHTADLVPGTVRTRRRVAGLGVGERGSSARVRGTGNQVELALDLALQYPAAVRAVVADIRKRVIDEVGKTTGYQVRTLDVTISALLPDRQPRVR